MIIIKTETVASFRVVRGRRKSGSVIECGYCETDAVKGRIGKYRKCVTQKDKVRINVWICQCKRC